MTSRFPALIAVLALAAFARGDELARQVLEEINFARTQPQQYAQIVADSSDASQPAAIEAVKYLQHRQPVPPLVWSAGISQAALSHALDVGPRGGSGHTGSHGDSPWKRMARYGQWSGYAGENIDYGHRDARSVVLSLVIDNGVPSRLHRINLFNRSFHVTGIGIAPHASSGTMCVMDFASGFVESGERHLVSRMGGALRSDFSGMSLF